MSKRGHDNYAQSLDELKSFHEWLAETVQRASSRGSPPTPTSTLSGLTRCSQYAADIVSGRRFRRADRQHQRQRPVPGLAPRRTRSSRWPPRSASRSSCIHRPNRSAATASRTFGWLSRWAGSWMSLSGWPRIVFGGRLEQYPDLNFVAATAGGAISLFGRADWTRRFAPRAAWAPRPAAPGAPRFARRRSGRRRRPGAAADGAVHEQDQRAAEHLPQPGCSSTPRTQTSTVTSPTSP